MSGLVVDLFGGGAGGWELPLSAMGVPVVGIEWDAGACLTRSAAGLLTIRADVASFPLDRLAGKVWGITGSPPCQDFSKSGKRAGLSSERGRLVWEPLRWAERLRPEWVALEQVEDVLPIWKTCRDRLREVGYSAWCGVLDAADYGTPQNRRRAILMASRTRTVAAPEPSHCKGGSEAGMFGSARLPWVSMADALGWGMTARPANTVVGSHDSGGSYGLDGGSEPAPTVALGHNQTAWCWERPATSVCSTPRVMQPGHHDGSQTVDAVKVEIWELGVLQGFPADYPWSGTKEQQARSVGDAIPPQLAEAVLRALMG